MSTELSRLKRWFYSLHYYLPFSCTTSYSNISDPSIVTPKEASEKKLMIIFDSLKREIKDSFHYVQLNYDKEGRYNLKSNDKSATLNDKIALDLQLLDEKLQKLFHLKRQITKGNNIDSTEILMQSKTLLLLIDCLRDEIFKSYLALSLSEKLALQEKDRQMSSIFALLGMLETEVRKYVNPLLLINDPLAAIKPFLKLNSARLRYKRPKRNDVIVSNQTNKNLLSTPSRSTKYLSYPEVAEQNHCHICKQKELSEVILKRAKFNYKKYIQNKSSNTSESSKSSSSINERLSSDESQNGIKDLNKSSKPKYIYTNKSLYTPIFYDNFLENVVEKNHLPTIESTASNLTKSWSSITNDVNKDIKLKSIDKQTIVSPSMLDLNFKTLLRNTLSEKSVQTYSTTSCCYLNGPFASTSKQKSSSDHDSNELVHFLINKTNNYNNNQKNKHQTTKSAENLWKTSAKRLLEQYETTI